MKTKHKQTTRSLEKSQHNKKALNDELKSIKAGCEDALRAGSALCGKCLKDKISVCVYGTSDDQPFILLCQKCSDSMGQVVIDLLSHCLIPLRNVLAFVKNLSKAISQSVLHTTTSGVQ